MAAARHLASSILACLALALRTGAATRVVVSGAGPAGLLSAHEILLRRPNARVTLFDRRPDPRTIASSDERAYSLGLNIRGRTALQHWEGLWEAVSSQGVLSSRFLLHLGSKELQLRSNRDGGVPTLLISRDALCSALLDFVQSRHAGRLDLRLGTAVERVDLARHECFTPEGECFPYDDLIGTDGVNSAVRAAMDAAGSGFRSETVDLGGQFKVFIQKCPEALAPDAVHAMGAKGYTLFSIPRGQREVCTLLAWNGEQPPDFLALDDAAIGARIAADLPKYGAPTAKALAQLRAQRPSKATTVRCNRYHDLAGRALLLGDAAHSTGGTLGQGANSALQDVVALSALLQAHGDAAGGGSIVQAVGEAFSARQQPEGLALWELLQLPPKGPFRLAYLAAQAAQGALAGATGALPPPLRVERPVQNALSESTMPFTEIIARNRFWVDMALKSAPGIPSAEFAVTAPAQPSSEASASA